MEANITKDLLEATLNTKIIRFQVESGLKINDEFTSPILSVDVWTQSGPNPLSLFIKFQSPNARQTYLDMNKSFETELRVYDTLVPEFEKFQEELRVTKIVPPFPQFFGGSYHPSDKKNSDLNNLLVLKDLHKQGGFRLRDKFLGLDLDHYKLVIEGQAQLHAISWAYKYTRGLKNFHDNFPFLKMVHDEDMETILDILDKECHYTCENIVQDDYEAVKALKYLSSVAPSVMGLYFTTDCLPGSVPHTKDTILKRPVESVENEEPWTAVCHGACWTNSMLFRYDEVTGKPIQVVFVDLQLTREGDPFTDVTYTLYCGTTREFRTKHLTSMLNLYFDTFTQICKHFSVPCYPGWSWEEFKRRFHRAKIYGARTVKTLPVCLKTHCHSQQVVNLEESGDSRNENVDNDEGDEFSELVKSLTKRAVIHPALRERLTGALQEFIDDGII
ncbi:unnamed protein product [Allacma fusca]|uniref:CHK kinase-like domain-containing protein n=1 Tax=Allacma fusca TaxID=39272 RepID=A0A8J2JUI4_9HEXA|nr:unnamed protein product [Allacma fusca]